MNSGTGTVWETVSDHDPLRLRVLWDLGSLPPDTLLPVSSGPDSRFDLKPLSPPCLDLPVDPSPSSWVTLSDTMRPNRPWPGSGQVVLLPYLELVSPGPVTPERRHVVPELHLRPTFQTMETTPPPVPNLPVFPFLLTLPFWSILHLPGSGSPVHDSYSLSDSWPVPRCDLHPRDDPQPYHPFLSTGRPAPRPPKVSLT